MSSRLFNGALRALALGGALLACSTTPPPSQLAENWGVAQRTNVAAMIAGPGAAERNTEPVDGLSAATAAGVTAQYHERQKASSQEEPRGPVLRLQGY